MAHTDALDTALTALAEDIGRSLRRSGYISPTCGEPYIGESFQVWVLPADALPTHGRLRRLSRTARNTHRWHHQLHTDDGPIGVARSREDSRSGDLELQEVALHDGAILIDEAVTWVDENADGDPLVRLLVVPALQLTALWLQDEDAETDRLVVTERAGVRDPMESAAAADAISTAQALGIVRGRGRPSARRSGKRRAKPAAETRLDGRSTRSMRRRKEES